MVRGRQMMKALREILKRKKGFTMIEVLLASALSTVSAGIIFSVLIGQQQNFLVGNSYIVIHQDARMAMDWLAKDVRWTIELSQSHGSHTTSDSCIVLKVPSIDSAGDIVDIENHHDFIIYELSGCDSTRMERIVDAKDGVSSRTDETRVVAENIASLAFSHDGTALSEIQNLSTVEDIDIALTASKTVTGLSLTDTLDTRLKFRNRE